RGMGALSDAEGCWHLEQAVMRGAPWRLAMRVFTDKMPPLQQALFNISATEKAATPVIPPADDNAFNGSLSDETAVMAWLKKRIAVQLRLSDPASLHPNQDLLQLGMDSLLFLELSSDIQHYLGVRINAERAWQDLSPHGLTQLICSKPEATPAASQPEVLRHDASHVVQTLRRLKLLLKAGGRLLIVEATERNSVFQLASVGFIEGLSGYRDFRRRDEKPMLTRSAWQEVLVQAGFANELAWPAQESSPLRQHLLVARSPGVNRPDKKAVSRYLQQRFGTGLPILQIRQREALFTPLHAPSDAPTEPAKPTPVAGGNPALEKQVAELWQSLLSRPVARHHDFFELGGDSLMATRMVAQLNRRGIARANLQDLFSHSTLSDFCAHLQAATSGEDNPIPLCQGDGEETLFVFHASDGDISAWLPLASALNRRVFGLQAKSPQRFATLDQMIDEYVGCIRRQQPHGPYVLAGWSYGAFLAAGAAQRLYAKGEQVRMVLIDPVCRQDFCCENRAALLRLLAEGQTPLALPEHFDQQTPDSQLADFISLAKTAGMVSQNLTLQAAETWLDNIAHLLRLLTEHTPGESVPVPCLMVYAAGRPSRWTPAETEWQGWINNADDAVIEASHWQIMMEAPHVQACAQHITRWLCATSTQPENTL
ncbi:TPA: alpha/beta fold hydrolase, partial [Escherichia coli]|nr:alpha/beta fold hydrolase [Escherichia coli]